MSKNTAKVALLLLLFGLVALAPAFAGSAVVGSVAGSTNATVGGVVLRPNTTLFSGDSVQVRDGVAIVAVGKTSRVVFGRETIASFLRDDNEVTVLLGQGNVSVFHPDDSVVLRVKVGDVSVTPEGGFKTLGEVAMLGNSLVVSSKEGTLLVDNGEQTVRVAKGKTFSINGKSARAPQAQGGTGVPGTGATIAWGTVFQVGSFAGSALSAILAGVALSKASDANSAAANAATQAASALSAAQAAASAAASAASAASSALGGVTNLCNELSPTTHATSCP